MPFLNLGEQSIFFLSNEMNTAKKDLSVIFIHGAGGNYRHWFYQWRSLANKGYQVFTIDLPGHGKTLGEPFARLEVYAEIINKLCLQLELKDTVLVGHSMGGAISLLAALLNKSLYKGLFLVGTGHRFPAARKLLELLNTKQFIEFLDILYGEFSNSQLKQKAYEEICKMPKEVFLKDYKACQQNRILLSTLNKLDLPVALMVGTEDKVTPPCLSLDLFNNLPNSNLYFIHKGNHMLMFQQRETVTAKILEFMAALK